MFEIEKKYTIPAAARENLRAHLERVYGKPQSLTEEDIHGFTAPDKTYLRLRRSGDQILLIAKGPTTLTDDGIRKRREVEVLLTPEAFAQARALVQLLFVESLPTMRRERLVWKLDGAEVVMDFLEELPCRVYVEVEVLSADQESALARLRALENELGLDPGWQETRSYALILQEEADLEADPLKAKKML